MARSGRIRARANILTVRTAATSRWDTHVLYAGGVPGAQINREEWAALIADLLHSETAGNKTKFAELVGVDRKTIARWLAREVAVSEESVRELARALRLQPAEILVRVGYYEAREIREMPPIPALTASDERAIRMIEESKLSPSAKRQLVELVHRRRAEHEQMRADEVRQLLEFRGVKVPTDS